MQLGERIKQARQLSGLSLKQVAERSGVTVSFLSQVERDRVLPSLKSLVKISCAIGIGVSYFFEENQAQTVRMALLKKDSRNKHLFLYTPSEG